MNENAQILQLLMELRTLVENQEKKISSLEEKIRKQNSCPELRRIWTPRDEVMDFLCYGDTQIAEITRKYEISTSEIGKRKFYSNSSLIQVLEKNRK